MAAEPAKTATQVPPRPTRTISDEFRELQYIINKFQEQLNSPDGIVGLHPYGPVNVEQAKQSFAQACKRLRDALLGYRDTTLVSWSRLFATEGGNPNLITITNRATAASQELVSMRQITDALHEDVDKCRSFLLDAAADAISRSLTNQCASLVNTSQTTMIIERLKAIAKRLGLAHYTDVQKRESEGEITTVTLAGGILVIDVDIGSNMEQLKVKVSYVSDIEHDERINTLMLGRLRAGDIRGFEKLVQEMATLDRLTNERSPANFIHNTFAIISTLAEIQKQEISALDGDSSQLLRYGTGIALPHAHHVGPSTLYYMPAVSRAGLTSNEWGALESNSLDGIADVSGCNWLYYSWESSSSPRYFLPALFNQHCLSPDYTIEDSDSHKVVTVHHPTIHGLDMRFLEFFRKKNTSNAEAMQVDGQGLATDINDEFWIPYTLVAQVEPPLPACALTIRGIMAATVTNTDDSTVASASASSDSNPKSLGGLQDSPRLLENAPTLESLVCLSKSPQSDQHASSDGFSTVHRSAHMSSKMPILLNLEQPQIRAWTIQRVPLNDPRNILSIVPLLRRQATFNELLASCIGDATEGDGEPCSLATPATVSAQTYANDPFRIDIVVRWTDDNTDTSSPSRMDVDQQHTQTSSSAKGSDGMVLGVVLRVAESTGDPTAWLHRDLGIVLPKKDPLGALGEVPTSSLSPNTSHKTLTKAVRISNSVPLVVSWMLEHSTQL
ncbi:hypothetical protein IW140_004860 [Coemansia sp. RSA 1813]|nr:hypothetical protein EV178_004906 [Coemansia sp. RSA 1646]KAJ1769493.1 hypothetical protein LPJ74_003979 [Coemansia sp. RSA 1843]KAJ2087493.1 hypothetical protein IW138_004953 [Coemansia sp. RSA 986]KAJ2216174.1 hypothetical protein EV179_001634 [Coemansia sp. RSA 487]KAJ2566672.1 hypothetical protein IW140_004860 [Coemansia sp. RSA 1813]